MVKISRVSAFLLFALSFVAVFLAFEYDLPLDHGVSESPEVFEVELEGLKKEGPIGTWSLPFPCRRPSDEKGEVQEASEEALPSVSFVYLGKERYTLIGEELLKEGDKWRGWKVRAITLSGIIVENEKGEKKWIGLEVPGE